MCCMIALQYGESKVGKMKMVENTSSGGLDSLQHRHTVMSQDGGEPQFSIKDRTPLCLQDTAGSQFISSRGKLKYWRSAEQRARLCGRGRCWHREAKAATTATSPLLPSFLSGPTSKVSLFFIAYSFSPEVDLFSDPLAQPMTLLSHNRTMISPFQGVCFAAHYRQLSAWFFSKTSPATKSIPSIHSGIFVIYTVLLITHFSLRIIPNEATWWLQCSAL